MKYNLLKSIMYVILSFTLFNSSLIQAQEDEYVVEKKRIKKKKKGKQIVADVQLDLGYSSNVFKTPEGTYLDPETGLDNISKKTSATFVNPDLSIEWLPLNKKRHKVSIEAAYDGMFYSGDTNVSNSNGYDTRADLFYEFSLKRKRIKVRKLSSKDQFKKIRKRKKRKNTHNLKIGGYLRQHKFNYIHRGTGGLRVTRLNQLEEENRYVYGENGYYFKYNWKLKKMFNLGAEVNFFSKDYEEVANFGSYDRDVSVWKLKFDYRIYKRWKLGFGKKMISKNYLSHKANSVTGASVTGTLRKYLEDESSVKISFKAKKIRVKFGYKYFTRDDTYASYWSYAQNKYTSDFIYIFNKKYRVNLEHVQSNRQYMLETNPDGAIRDRTNTSTGLSLKKSNSWGDVRLAVNDSNQVDKDPYYTYKKQLYSLSYSKEF